MRGLVCGGSVAAVRGLYAGNPRQTDVSSHLHKSNPMDCGFRPKEVPGGVRSGPGMAGWSQVATTLVNQPVFWAFVKIPS